MPGEDTRVLVAEGLAAWLQREALPPVVRDAEMMLRGEYPVTVAHGMPETPQEEAVVFYLLGHLAAETGCATSRSGGSEHTTFVFAGEGAKGAADQFLRAAREVGARWWKVTATSQPPWA